MSIKHLVVAGMAAVVLMAGSVSAQAAQFAVTDKGKKSAAFDFVFNSAGMAELTFAPYGNASRKELVDTVAIVGMIQVTCTYTNWDVGISFKNGGKMYAEGTPDVIECSAPDLFYPNGKCDTLVHATNGPALLDGSSADAVLHAAVAVVMDKGGLTGIQPDVKAEVDITAGLGWIKVSAADETDPVFLSQVLYGALGAETVNGRGGNVPKGTSTLTIMDNGFPGTPESAPKPTTFAFYAGLNGQGLGDNDDGDYKEVITATLYAAW